MQVFYDRPHYGSRSSVRLFVTYAFTHKKAQTRQHRRERFTEQESPVCQFFLAQIV